jgi:hypothetical protein
MLSLIYTRGTQLWYNIAYEVVTLVASACDYDGGDTRERKKLFRATVF